MLVRSWISQKASYLLLSIIFALLLEIPGMSERPPTPGLTLVLTRGSYLGKSTGAGALGIWLHNPKRIDFLNCESRYYSGKAIRIDAGVQAFEAYDAAHKTGLAILGGEILLSDWQADTLRAEDVLP